MIKQGKTKPNEWKSNNNGGGGIYIDVDTSTSEFPSTPHYLTTLEGDIHHWDAGGFNSIYSPTKDGFRVYVKWVFKRAEVLTPQIANQFGWYIKWTGILVE